MRPEAAFPYVFAAEGAQHPPKKPPHSTPRRSIRHAQRRHEKNIRHAQRLPSQRKRSKHKPEAEIEIAAVSPITGKRIAGVGRAILATLNVAGIQDVIHIEKKHKPQLADVARPADTGIQQMIGRDTVRVLTVIGISAGHRIEISPETVIPGPVRVNVEAGRKSKTQRSAKLSLRRIPDVEPVRIDIHSPHRLKRRRVIDSRGNIILPAPVTDRSESVDTDKLLIRPPQIRLETVMESVKALHHILDRVLLDSAVGRRKQTLVLPKRRISGYLRAETASCQTVTQLGKTIAFIAYIPGNLIVAVGKEDAGIRDARIVGRIRIYLRKAPQTVENAALDAAACTRGPVAPLLSLGIIVQVPAAQSRGAEGGAEGEDQLPLATGLVMRKRVCGEIWGKI